MIRLHKRRGFTLVEMLVVMGIIVLITGAAMLIVPGALNRDRSTDAVTSLRGWLEIAQARAARDGAPRGLRLIVDITRPPAEQLWITEVQYTEAPPVLVFNTNPPYPTAPTAPLWQIPALTPRVEFRYTVAPSTSTTPLPGTVTGRQCFIRGLDINQASQVINATSSSNQPALWMPVLGTWHRIIATNPAYPNPPLPVVPPTTPVSYDVEVLLDGYPDTQLGSSTHYVTYHFGIFAPPRPLLGEPTMQLPTNTCVDLLNNPNPPFERVSTPGLPPPPLAPPPGYVQPDFDILFAPSGSLAFTPAVGGDSHVFLCVRDPRRGSPMNLFDPAQIRLGGEMMILAIKSRSGAIAVQPVDLAGDPYSFAKQSVSSQ